MVNKVILKKSIVGFIIVCMLLTGVILLSKNIDVYAVTNACDGSYSYLMLGNGYADYQPGIWDFIISGYVYYDANGTSNIKFHSMKQIITNQGTMIVNDFEFTAHDNDFSEYDTHTIDYIEVEKGETCVIEADWHAVNDIYYSKGNGTSEAAYSSQTAGVSESSVHAGWHQYWYTNSTDNEFHS